MRFDETWRPGRGFIVQEDPSKPIYHLVWDNQMILASLAIREKVTRFYPDGHLRYIMIDYVDGPNGKAHPLGRRMFGRVEEQCVVDCPGCSGLSRTSAAFAVQKRRAINATRRYEC